MHRRALAPLFLLALALLPFPAAAGIDRWTPVGPDTGVVRELAAAPSHLATVYAGLTTGGVYRSQDGGASWTFAAGGLDLKSQINALAVDARLPNRLWAATDTAIFRSADGGAHWAQVRDGGAQVLAADPKASGTVYAPLGFADLQRSADSGATWQTLARPPIGIVALAIDPVEPQNLYAGTQTTIFLSKDRGVSWRRGDRGLPASPFAVSLAIDPRAPRTVYLSIAGSAPSHNVFRSHDGGISWTAVDQGRLVRAGQLAVDPGRSGAVWAVTATGLFRSLDRGLTWSHADAGLPADEVITVLPGATLLAGTGAGVFRSANRGAAWSPSSQGIDAAALQGLALDPLRPLRLWTLDDVSNVFRTTSGGERWALLPQVPHGPAPGPLASDPNRPATVYLGLLGAVARSADAGNHWSVGATLLCLQPQTIAVDPRDSSVVYVTGGLSDAGCGDLPDVCGFYRSDDSGTDWSCIGGNLPSSFVKAVAPDPLQSGTVYTVVADDVYRSTDRGATWSLRAPQPNLLVLVADPLQPGRLWAGGSFGVHRSDDGGLTWTPDAAGLPVDDRVQALALDPVTPGVAYAGTVQHGVFKTTDDGATWTALGPGLEGLDTGFLALDPRDRATLYAGTRLRGVWKLQQSGD